MPPKNTGKKPQKEEENDEDLLNEFAKNSAASRQESSVAKVAQKVLMEQLQKRQEMMLQMERMQEREELQSMRMQEEMLKRTVQQSNITQNPGRQVELEGVYKKWAEVASNTGKYVRYEQFRPDMMVPVMKMISDALPEPYSLPTFEYFIMGYPDLCILLFGTESKTGKPADDAKGDFIGVVVSSLKMKHVLEGPNRGYIAMLAVVPEWRGHRLGQQLVKLSIQLMKDKRAEEICLDTPVWNQRALKLYTDMGFSKTKYLTRYYMDGSDAIRLKFWFDAPENLMEKQLKQSMPPQRSM